jgi:hypothetical protein
MKKTLILAAVLLCGALAVPAAFADAGGRCHFHGTKSASETVVRDCASQRKEALVKAGKLDKTWQALAVDKIEQVEGKKGKEWKVTFKDVAAKDRSKETLYMFFTLPGNFIAANFTGL